jgi:hypothetical protein
VRNANPFSTGTAADGIGFIAASIAVKTEEDIVWDVAGPIAARPFPSVPAWESDQHTLALIARLIPNDHLMIRVRDMTFNHNNSSVAYSSGSAGVTASA